MKLFDITLPKANYHLPSLYYRAEPSVLAEGNVFFVPKNGVLSFDTYFNCFSYKKYTENTIITELGIALTLKGQFTIKLIKINADTSKKDIIDTLDFSSDKEDTVKLFAKLNGFTDEGFIYIELTSHKDNSAFVKGEYFTDTEPINKAKIALVFCTYKREEFLFHNIDNINNYLKDNPDITKNFEVLVIDNGNTITKDKANGFLLFPNKNLGGSGGFTRGIIEVNKKDFTHFLLMDDDIKIDCNVLRKTYSILRYAKDTAKLAIGGAMLELDNPSIQYEMGGKSIGLRLYSLKTNIDLTTIDALLINEREEFFNYNAWWYMCMPISVVKEKGLPLPLFIKGDDVEYGLRFDGNILLVNGIGVWHESFDNKQNAVLEYYIVRNEMIVTALYFPNTGIIANMKKLYRAMGYRLLHHKYYEIKLIVKAVNDFLKGPFLLSEIDAESLHKKLLADNKKRPIILDGQYSKKQLILKLNIFKLFNAGLCLALLFLKMLKYKRIAKRWKAAMPKLTSYELWYKLLNLNNLSDQV